MIPDKGWMLSAPSGTFLHDYMELLADQETARAFDFWSGVWLLSCAVGRRVVVPRPRAPVFLNNYVALIGNSGIVRKSSVIKIASTLARPLIARDKQIGLLTAKSTPEALDRVLHQRNIDVGCSQLVIAISELATFMGSEGYTIGMPALLTDLYDCPDHRDGPGSMKDGPIRHKDVWVSFLTASTPTWLLKTVNPVVSEGGFTSRCLFICADQPKRRIAWPDHVDAGKLKQQRDHLLDKLLYVQSVSRSRHEVKIDPLALERFKTWYDERQPSLDNYVSTFQAREDAHVLRSAALLSINDGTWSISVQHMTQAIELVALVKKTSSVVFARAGERSRYGAALELARTILITSGMDPVPRGILYRRMAQYVDHSEFSAMIDALHEMKAVQRFTLGPQSGGGRPTDYVRGTQALLMPGLGERVIAKLAL